MAEVYAFARVEPLDEPLQKMLAELTATLARVHGNDLSAGDFMLVRQQQESKPDASKSDAELRTQQIVQHFARAAKANSGRPKRKSRPQPR